MKRRPYTGDDLELLLGMGIRCEFWSLIHALQKEYSHLSDSEAQIMVEQAIVELSDELRFLMNNSRGISTVKTPPCMLECQLQGRKKILH